MTGGGDPDEIDDVPVTDLDDVTVQDQADAVSGWSGAVDVKSDASDPIPSAGASDIGGRAPNDDETGDE